jgi:serine/threonine-protein kinase
MGSQVRRRATMRAVPSAALAAALLLGGGAAQASPFRAPLFADDPAAAQALFSEAKKLMTAGKYADACPKLEESERASPAVGTKFNLSDCYEHIGKTASAWAGFLSVAAAAKNANQGAREKAARERAKALESKLSRIAIVVPDTSNVASLEVKRDDEVVGSGQWAEALPVDPGQHTITATAQGKRPWKTIIEVAPAGGSAKVIIPALDDEPTPPPAPAAAAAPASAPGAAAPPASSGDSSGARVTAGWVLLATGVVALVGGGVFWGLRSSDVSTLQSQCTLGASGNQCPSSDSGDISNGKMYDAVSVALFAVGGVAVLTGGGLLLFGGGHDHAASSARVVPVVGPQGGGVRFVASF